MYSRVTVIQPHTPMRAVLVIDIGEKFSIEEVPIIGVELGALSDSNGYDYNLLFWDWAEGRVCRHGEGLADENTRLLIGAASDPRWDTRIEIAKNRLKEDRAAREIG
jgi:hypothetical protein